MANKDHLALLQQGVEAWNQWRRENWVLKPDLSGANFVGADLSGVNLSETNLNRANLSRANLGGADLRGANLSRADLRGANLHGANLGRANLIGADLSGADLIGTDLFETVLADLDLSSTKGLDACNHVGPSILDHRTLQRSGPLPEIFLRGCGLPDILIDYLPTLFNQPIQYYSCFISYSSKDEDFAKRLHADLQAKGVRCWFAPHDVQAGKKLHEQIDTAIRLHDKLLLVLSGYSMRSKWVATEITKARKREDREGKRVLFPIRLVDFQTFQDWECFDADIGKDSAREIREYFIPDFSNWKDHDAYQLAFERLLQDLKPELEKPPRTEGS